MNVVKQLLDNWLAGVNGGCSVQSIDGRSAA
jgi:hypothetical protein